MRSKILVVLIAVAVMGVSSAAMARGGGAAAAVREDQAFPIFMVASTITF